MKTIKVPETQKDLRKLKGKGIEVEFIAEMEHISPTDQFEEDKTTQKVIDDYNSGNMAAWFCAHVKVKYRGYEDEDYLGGCSYRSFSEFKKDAYYLDMVRSCIENINEQIEWHNHEVKKEWDIRRAINLTLWHKCFSSR